MTILCPCTYIGPEAFLGLSDLRYLDLSLNGLSSLPNDAFKHVASLEELQIGSNKLTSLGRRDLALLKSLKVSSSC